MFQYKARNNEGAQVSGLVEAPNMQAASRLLREKKFLVVNLVETKEQHGKLEFLDRFKRVSFNDTVNFTRQLATMIVAGLSLPEALTILRNQTTNPAFAQVLLDVEHQIVGGGNLADSLGKYPAYFSPIYLSLIKAGESSGKLDKVLSRLADTLEKQREFKSKVVGAMIYPVIILIGMGVVIAVMMTVVVPKLSELYKDFGITLPLTTQILIAISNFFVMFWWLMILAGIGGGIALSRWLKTPVGKRIADEIVLKIPLFGELTKKVVLVDFTRTLGMLISSGIHILDGLRILRNSLGNVLFQDAIDKIAAKVEKGFPIGETFAEYPIFPPIVSQMMKVGEETGKLDDTLTKLANYFETESEHLVKGLTTAIEPLIMVVLGVGVGFIVLSVITPIYNLTAQFK